MGTIAKGWERVAALVSVLLAGLPAEGQHFTHSGFFHWAGTAPSALAVGDFNGDGKPDVAIAITNNTPSANGQVGIQLNCTGDIACSPFSFPLSSNGAAPTYGVGPNPVFIGTGVFTSSGRTDLAVVNQFNGTVSILINNGGGVFAPDAGGSLTTGSSPATLVIADFNGDGKADIAVTNGGSNTVSVFLGNGNGTFTAATSPTFATGTAPQGIDAADIDGDGKIDLVVANSGDDTIAFHKGNGDGTFQAGVASITSFNSPVRVKAGFFDSDNFRDVAIAASAVSGGGFEVMVGNGGGSFAASGTRQVPADQSSRFVVGRWDGDFVNDIALIHDASGSPASFPRRVSTYNGTASATYSLLENNVTDPAEFVFPVDLAAGDFDGDGAEDLAVLFVRRQNLFADEYYFQIYTKTHEAAHFNSSAITLNATVTQAITPLDLNQFLDFGLPTPTWSGTLPSGLTLSSAGVITGAPAKGTTGGPYNPLITATVSGTSGASKFITINIAKSSQTVTFTPPDIDFSANPVAITGASSPALSGSFTYGTNTPSKCSVSGSNVTPLDTGTCTLTAQHSGDGDFLASSTVQASFTIRKLAQTITFTNPIDRRVGTSSSFTFGGGNDGVASSDSGLTLTLGTSTPLICTVTGTTVNLLDVGTCKITLDQTGNNIYNAAAQKLAQFEVTQNTAPAAPTLLSLIRDVAGGAANATFAPNDNGGSPVTNFTVTCDPGGITSAPSTSTTINISGLTNGTQYSCSVKSTNAKGTGASSNALNVTPYIVPDVNSANNTAFTRTQFGTFTVTSTGAPAPTYVVVGALPSGVSLSSGGVLSGTPALGSDSGYQFEIQATNIGGMRSQFFTLTVNRIAQSITFASPGNKPLATGQITLNATAPGGNVIYNTIGPVNVCEIVQPDKVKLNGLGTCSVTATQGATIDYFAATDVTRTFDVVAGPPGAPQLFVANPGNGQVVLQWQAPASNGGSAITGYTATCNPGGHTATTTGATNVVVTSLTNGVENGCTVKATNANGDSPPSNELKFTPGTAQVTVAPQTLDFGGVSMGTTSVPLTVTLSNTGNLPVTISQASVAAGPFAIVSNTCGALAIGASCTVQLTFTAPVGGGSLNSVVQATANLFVTSDAPSSPHTAALFANAEKSLVTHYYRAILGRAPDSGGKTFWQTEAQRLKDIGVNVNEAWFAMANFFFTSAEYQAFNRSDAGYTTDLYNTFFNRPPDSGGLAFWTGQLGSGMPREVVLVSFMLSTEFVTFTQNIFGNTAARAEVDTVVDFYRGLLARLPDTTGLQNWVTLFRAAQCAGAPQQAVNQQVEAISSSFATGAEYAGRNRTNSQYVGDLYNSFLRRGGDLTGVQFWINELDNQARTRENVRQQFVASAEFQGRVQNILNQGCLP